ncbi:tetratricopeptide repeat protein [Streptomyces abyssalis]|uniref:tetratricopeptide repeat protein n=1 Tax=Streptomyces abyssalis TaxID=933944 RepID=UPI001112CC7C|nr:tetratricopeptide repeat protein [Streptomyces abyssalis]
MQEVRAEAGYAYGAMGADIHVFGDGTPVYLLFERAQVTAPDSAWLRAQPSRMLDARAEVVGFTGREAELRALVDWRDAEGAFAVRWLHGEGGQGKTRLATELAADAQRAGWKVVDAVHGTDTHPPAEDSQDLRLDGCAGVLVLVDYADRWPVTHLSWLFHNRLLRHRVPARVLLLARSAGGWPAVRGRLNRLRAGVDTSDQHLPPLPGTGTERAQLFGAARDSFVRHYPQVERPEATGPPGALTQPDFGLTLAVLMAALVAVDATANGRRAPGDMVGLTTYLLDREHENWQQLYENSSVGLDYGTPSEVMKRLVFTAGLTGLTSRPAAEALLRSLLPGLPAGELLADHAVCYPPPGPAGAGVLQPLLPDRLAEDYVALTLPGSPVTAYATDSWAATGCATLLARDRDGVAPTWIARTVTFLAAAADRWPHVGHRHLYPALDRDPDLAAAAGSAALVHLAQVEDVDMAMLEAVDGTLNSRTGDAGHADLDVGAAATCERVTRHQLVTVSEPGPRIRLLSRLGLRLAYAGRQMDALNPLEEAVQTGRHRMAEGDPDVMPGQAVALNRLSRVAAELGMTVEAFRLAAEAGSIGKALVGHDPETHLPALAETLSGASDLAEALGRPELALDLAEEAVATHRLFLRTGTGTDSAPLLHRLAGALSIQGARLRELGRFLEAAQPTMDALAIHRKLVEYKPAAHLADFAHSLRDFGITQSQLDRREGAAESFEHASTVLRRLVERNPAAHLSDLADVLGRLGSELAAQGRTGDALSVTEEAVAIHRREAEGSLSHTAGLADALRLLGLRLAESDRTVQAADAATEAITLRWGLARTNPVVHSPALAEDLATHGRLLRRLGRSTEAESVLRQAVDIQRLACEHDPGRQRPPLAGILDELANALTDLGRADEARTATQEATGIRRDNARRSVPRPSAAAASSGLAGSGSREPSNPAGGTIDASVALETAISTSRRLAEEHPSRHLPVLACALSNLAQHHFSAGRPDAAVEPVREATEMYRRLAQEDSGYVPLLAQTLNGLGSALYALDRYEPALVPIEEAGTIYRGLAETDPGTYKANLASSLGRIGLILDKLGFADRARKALLESAALRRSLPPGEVPAP